MERSPRGSIIPVTPPVQSLTENTGNLSLKLVNTGSRLQRDHRAAPHHHVLHGASKRNESSPSQANKNKINPCVYKVQGTAQLWARALRKQDSFKAPGAAAGEQQGQDGPAKLPAAAAGPGSPGLSWVLPSGQGDLSRRQQRHCLLCTCQEGMITESQNHGISWVGRDS